MPLEIVHIDRVFGIKHTSLNRKRVTLFGFESESRKEYPVAAPGKPRIESGMTITAYLSEAGNWQTLVGWRDHESGEIVCESEGKSIFLCVWCVLGLCMMAHGVWQRSVVLSAISVGLVATFVWGVRNVRYLRRVRRELDAAATMT
jgi:hypothetical protein